MSVPGILQMRTVAQAWSDPTKYWPHCKLLFFMMKSVPVNEEALVGTSFGLCYYVRTVEAREAFVVTSFGLCNYIRIREKKTCCIAQQCMCRHQR